MIAPTVMSYDQLKALLPTDELKLVEELARQGVYYEMICFEGARLGQELAAQKILLDTTRASISATIREMAEKAGGKRATNDSVEEQVLVNDSYLMVKTALLKVELEYNNWCNLKRAWELKADATKSIVSLVNNGYR